MSRETRLNVPKNEQYYYDEESNTYKPLAQNGAIPVVIIGGGVAGGSSMNFLNGEGKPTDDIGLDGDTYLDSVNGDFYKKENASWVVIANLKGAKGDTGAKGADGLSGKSAYQIWLDAGNTGSELDFLNSLKGEKGVKGDTGAKGDKGDKGDAGAKGNDGFGTKEQYDDIIARLEELENPTE